MGILAGLGQQVKVTVEVRPRKVGKGGVEARA
jgi:hypothetical protein